MQGHHLNDLPTFSLVCSMLMQVGVVGLLVSQSFDALCRLWIFGMSACLLVCSFLLLIGHGLWMQHKNSH
jgi:hypothetical protein